LRAGTDWIAAVAVLTFTEEDALVSSITSCNRPLEDKVNERLPEGTLKGTATASDEDEEEIYDPYDDESG
jgi:hypothetical protein